MGMSFFTLLPLPTPAGRPGIFSPQPQWGTTQKSGVVGKTVFNSNLVVLITIIYHWKAGILLYMMVTFGFLCLLCNIARRCDYEKRCKQRINKQNICLFGLLYVLKMIQMMMKRTRNTSTDFTIYMSRKILLNMYRLHHNPPRNCRSNGLS